MAQAHAAHDGSHGSYSSYLIGFVLAVILTVASFAAVMTHALSPGMALAALTVLAVVQIVVHLVFFLHLNTSSEQSWNLMCFIFAAASVIVIIGGTIFIMHDTAINMMSR
ncbi:MAG: cytochrome o ubiquinol oxidase subunit IV [Gluconobacter potus]|uniref:Cytochrome bo(3) ubiquinol oxidase subunit 4 n=1 Tax=Gluconobacter potus TaxID=2724927 RepID=A0ABR9YM90_9PROT|nr:MULTISPECIES: cytochrome o ubiquinol oxidase subunit IV [Gluconobacter]MBF0849731.1 cytochrome o ubiquinol oxidase subunit IV [Gluconobacter sp. R75690]MBF0864702.1 cytochrome o ubiquinol oxidase subunit IV [Gluconobacter sp. R71656]MBF0866904.1 cytochrome o ubiquinol oxidase subunit IV [Gluconobacter sp. R75628]MBF0873219.1 cytochrome o ubiquinol oxidase subunit IV [Gluconobacter sp. R75629]MBF0878040.1 cytochrome o ubiquinol oxidase subunit IV [Gluconobacter sp. R75828]